MLYKNELHSLFRFLWFLSKIGFIPVNITLNPVQFSFKRSKLSVTGLCIVRLLFLCRTALLWYSLALTVIHPPKKFFYFLAPLCCTVGTTAVSAMDYYAVKARPLFSSLLNLFHQQTLPGKRRWKSGESIAASELLVIFTPELVLILTVPTTVLMYFYHPSMPALLWALVPSHYRNAYSFSAILFLDLASAAAVICFSLFIVFCATSIVTVMDNKMTMANKKIYGVTRDRGLQGPLLERRILNGAFREIREIRTWFKLFNEEAANIILVAKELSLAISVICLFIAIYYFDRSWTIAFSGFVLGVPMLLIYNIIFDKAFRLPDKMERIKHNFRLASRYVVDSHHSQYYALLALSIQFKGIQVGSFGVIEREATPIFLNFVIQQIATLLVGADLRKKVSASY